MPNLTLIIGNKNYSSWSFRPFMALVQAGIEFKEQLIPFGPGFTETVQGITGGRTVPALIHGDHVVWDSLAILEYLADCFPDKQLWPRDLHARALARSMSAEMHSSFTALRKGYPMNMHRAQRPAVKTLAMDEDIARIEMLWAQARTNYGAQGPFLFGKFSNADAMFAPIVSRFITYEVPASKASRKYMEAIAETRAFQLWRSAAVQEAWRCEEEERD